MYMLQCVCLVCFFYPHLILHIVALLFRLFRYVCRSVGMWCMRQYNVQASHSRGEHQQQLKMLRKMRAKRNLKSAPFKLLLLVSILFYHAVGSSACMRLCSATVIALDTMRSFISTALTSGGGVSKCFRSAMCDVSVKIT